MAIYQFGLAVSAGKILIITVNDNFDSLSNSKNKDSNDLAASLLRTNSSSAPILLRISTDGITRLIVLMVAFSLKFSLLTKVR